MKNSFVEFVEEMGYDENSEYAWSAFHLFTKWRTFDVNTIKGKRLEEAELPDITIEPITSEVDTVATAKYSSPDMPYVYQLDMVLALPTIVSLIGADSWIDNLYNRIYLNTNNRKAAKRLAHVLLSKILAGTPIKHVRFIAQHILKSIVRWLKYFYNVQCFEITSDGLYLVSTERIKQSSFPLHRINRLEGYFRDRGLTFYQTDTKCEIKHTTIPYKLRKLTILLILLKSGLLGSVVADNNQLRSRLITLLRNAFSIEELKEADKLSTEVVPTLPPLF